MNARQFTDRLQRRALKAGLTVSPELAGRLEAYYRLLAVWNAKVNLTGLDLGDASDDAFDRLLIEPLAAVRYVSADAARMLDVGSGGGSPAIPFKLAAPHLSLTMIESKTRKSVFLREVIRSLSLEQTEVVTARFEELLTRPDFHESHDIITIRAVRTETRVLAGLQAFLRPGGLLLLFRGPAGGDAAESVNPALVWRGTYPLVESLRSRLVVLEKRRLGHLVP